MPGQQTQVVHPSDGGYGESFRYDKNFRGPLAKRGCTDVICLLMFFLFLIAFGFTGYFAKREGDLDKLLIPRNSKGHLCGFDSEVRDKKFLFFFDLSKCADASVAYDGCPTPQICVKECPTETFIHNKDQCKSDLASYRKKLICTDKVDVSKLSCDEIDMKVNNQECAKFYLSSEPLGNRCLPTKIEDVVGIVTQSDMIKIFENIQLFGSVSGMGQMIVQDIAKTWPLLLAGLGIAAFCSLIIIAVMRWVAGTIVWISIVGVNILLGIGVYYSYREYDFYSKNPVERYNLQPNIKSYINSFFVKADVWLYILIATSIVLCIILLFVIFFRKRIVIAIALIKEGSKAVSSNLTTVFFPIFPWILQALVIVASIIMYLYLSSIGEPSYKLSGLKNDTSCRCTGNYTNIKDGDSCDPTEFLSLCQNLQKSSCVTASCHYIGLHAQPIVQYFRYLNIFGLFWLLFFVKGFSEMVLAGTFATWYWTMRKDDVPFFTLSGSIYRTVRFHLGTIAFGSLILTICRIIRLIIEYIDQKCKKYNNELTRAILCCCRCFFWCLENFLKFLNKNAYIMCAIHGKNFCSSARDSFNLLMRNVLRVVALDKTTDFLFFLSKLLISLGMAGCAFTYITSELFTQHFPGIFLQYPIAQVVLIFLGSYVIASVFFSVYSMAVDTLFLCFLEDCERNDGSPDRPFFMSKNLMRILNKTNK